MRSHICDMDAILSVKPESVWFPRWSEEMGISPMQVQVQSKGMVQTMLLLNKGGEGEKGQNIG